MNIKFNKFFEMLLSISLVFSVIILAAKFTLNFRPLYYYDIDYLKIEDKSKLSKDEIKENYNYVIDYLNEDNDMEFQLPSLPFSEHGKIHFEEVKVIFDFMDRLLIVCIIISILSVIKKSKNIKVLKYVSNSLIAFPLILITAIGINFDAFFTTFHKIFFRNDYWIFNSKLDPIIKILPEEFFMHCALFILFIIIFVSIILRIIYFRLNKKRELCRKLTM